MPIFAAAANDNEPMSAFLLGMSAQVAALAGAPLSANPYRTDTKEGLCWMAAWAGAKAALWDVCESDLADRDLA